MECSSVASDVGFHVAEEVASPLVHGQHQVLDHVALRCCQNSLAVEVNRDHFRARDATLKVAIATSESLLFICCHVFMGVYSLHETNKSRTLSKQYILHIDSEHDTKRGNEL